MFPIIYNLTVNPLIEIEVNEVLKENYVDDSKSKLEIVVIAFNFGFVGSKGVVNNTLYDGMMSVYVFSVVNAIHVPDRQCDAAQ